MSEILNPLIEALIALVAFLDSMPAYIRALLAGLIAVVILRFFELRVNEDEIQFCQSYRKTCLAALMVVPLVVAFLPGSRMAFFVEVVPDSASWLEYLWPVLGGIWLIGAAVATLMLLKAYWRRLALIRHATQLSGDEKVFTRLTHWQNRLGMRRAPLLVQINSGLPFSLPGSRRLGFPGSAMVGPDNVADILLIHELCHHKRHSYGWLLAGNLVACCYWPITWVPELTRRLLAGFQISTDSLAESCYGDPIGYDRGLRALEARSVIPGRKRAAASAAPDPEKLWQRYQQHLIRYTDAVRSLQSPQTSIDLQFEALFSSRENRHQHINDEPYDKVFWFVGQAVILALLISGPTLKPMPPDVESDYFLPFQFVWMENFHRNQERLEHNLPEVETVQPPE